jgi:uncharacterized membrane protein YfcA
VLPILAWAFVMVTMSAAAQALTGFGFALLAVPLLALVTSVENAVVAACIASLALTSGTTWVERAHVRWSTAGRLVAASAVGLPIGLLILTTLSDRALAVLVGVVVLASTWIVWRRPTVSGSWPTLAGIGVLVGVLTTSTGTNGPPLVAAFQSLGYPPRAFRATLATVFTGCGAVSLGLFIVGGEVSPRALDLALVGIPAIALGWWLGDRVFHRVPAERFRGLVLVALILASTITIVRSFI